MVDQNSNTAGRHTRPWAIIRRRGWIVVLCAVIGAVAAFGLAKRSPKRYTATASLLFQTSTFSQQLFGYAASTGNVDPTIQQATNVELVSEPVVGVDTAKKLGLAALPATVSVSPSGASSVVDVAATADSPALAAKIANAYANEFVAYETQSSVAQVNQAIGQLRSQIRKVQAAAPHSVQLATLQTRLSQLQALASLQTGNVQIAQSALTPSTPSSPRTSRDVALGFVAGLIVGILFALLAERLDQKLRDPEEVKTLLDLPLLGSIPASRTFSSRSRGRGTVMQGAEAEAFGLLRAQLRYFNVDRQIRSVLVTSPGVGDGKSTVAWNLATSVAALSPASSVLIVDSDLRRPRIAGISGEPATPGLSELLTHDLTIEQVRRTLPLDAEGAGDFVPTLDVITAGALPPNPAELMDSQKLQAVMHELEQRYDFIVFDAPPPSIVPDAIPLMHQVSGLIVVVRLRQSRRRLVRQLREQLDRLGAPCLGLVLNDVPKREAGYRYDQYTAAYTESRRAVAASSNGDRESSGLSLHQ